MSCPFLDLGDGLETPRGLRPRVGETKRASGAMTFVCCEMNQVLLSCSNHCRSLLHNVDLMCKMLKYFLKRNLYTQNICTAMQFGLAWKLRLIARTLL